MASSNHERYDDEIIRLFYDEGWSQKKVMQHMLEKYGFRATPRQYRTIREKSGRSKKLTSALWAHILSRIADRRNSGKASEIYWHGKRVPEAQVEREIVRRRSIHQSARATDLSRLVIRTPSPPSTPLQQAEEQFEWMDATEQSSWQPLVDNQREAVAWSPYVPSEAMSEHDYGCLETLTWATLMLGIPTLGRNLHYLFGCSSTGFPFGFDRYVDIFELTIPTSPDHSWTQESLMLALSAENLKVLWHSIPGFPKADVELHACSKSNLLNMAVNTIVNVGPPEYNIEPLLRWIVEERHIRLVQFICRSRDSRIQAFAWNLIGALRKKRELELYFSRLPSFSESGIKAVISICYETLRNTIWTTMSVSQRVQLLSTATLFGIRDIDRDLVTSWPESHSKTLWRSVLLRLDYLLMEELLKQGCSVPRTLLEDELEDNRSYLCRGKRYRPIFKIAPFLFSHGFDLDFITTKFFPFTWAQAMAIMSPNLHDHIRQWTKHATTMRLIDALQNLQKTQYLPRLLCAEREFFLLGATLFDNVEFARSLLETRVDPNCDEARAIIQKAYTQRTEYLGIGPCVPENNPFIKFYLGRRCGLVDGQPFLSSPIEFAIECRSAVLLELFIDAGARLQGLLTPSTFVFKPNLEDDAFQFMSQIAHLLLRPDLLPGMGHILLYFSVMFENHALLSEITQSLIGLGYTKESCLTAFSTFEPCLRCRDAGDPICWRRTTALRLALAHCSIDTVKFLWDHGARFGQEGRFSGADELAELCSWIWFMPRDHFQEKFDFLLSKNASLHNANEAYAPLQAFYIHPIDCSWSHRYSWVEAKMPWVLEVMCLLVSMGADFNLKNSIHSTPLQGAAQSCHFAAVRYLVAQRADVNLVLGSPPVSALVWLCADITRHQFREVAYRPEQSATIQLLLSSGAEIDLGELGSYPSRYKHGWTALGMACVSNRQDLVDLLVQNGADLQTPPLISKASYLQLACSVKRVSEESEVIKFVQFLLDSGVDVDPTESYATSALQQAAAFGNFELVVLLLVAGADVNYVPTDRHASLSEPAIFIAVRRQHYDIVKVLLNAGARIDRALKLAEQCDYYNIADLIKNHQKPKLGMTDSTHVHGDSITSPALNRPSA